MKEFHVEVSTPDGQMECFAAHPDGEGPFPGVILYMDVPGIREELHNFTRRIAEQGYLCLLPDMYYRAGRVRFDLSKGRDELQRMFAMGSSLDVPMIMSDTGAMLDYFEGNPEVGGLAGCVGHCMGGQFVVAALGSFPDQFGAGVALYGPNIVTDGPDSPHLLADRIQGELYLGYAAHDPYVDEKEIPALTAALDANGVRYTLETHPGTEHGFCFPERPAYHEEASEKVWNIMFDLYNRTLRS